MPRALRQRTVAGVLFDESHGEAWTIRPELAASLQPEHPAGLSYALAASALADRDFTVASHSGSQLAADTLAGVAVLVFAHPSDPSEERTVGGSATFSSHEIDAVEAFVEGGGGLIVLGETEEGHPGADLQGLLHRFGLRTDRAAVEGDGSRTDTQTRVLAEPAVAVAEPSLLHLVHSDVGLLAAVRHGQGRVVVAGDAGLFGDESIGEGDHLQLWLNLVYWVGAAAFAAAPEAIVSAARDDPAWPRLREATDALRMLQEPKGEVDLGAHRLDEVEDLVQRMRAAIAELAHYFPHEGEYLEQVRTDLAAWVEDGCAKPDFTASLALFRPERHRRDGIEHLVVFPMYTPNGSPDTRFEALLVRTPWPEFIDRLERGGFDNSKYLPVQLVDYTAGYESECAVLFPETVSVTGRPTNNYGGIFCDREAARFQVSTARGAEVLRIDLPPDAAALVSNGDLVRETYILWDMIHDRWHSHGDLPFDPFMIRQRLPYWMYSLEELRVDLATYGSAAELVREGFAFARYVQYAILFDRILRFPITGNRVRNYDGLGGQLLFAYLHQHDVVRWTDNRLLIDWERIEGAVADLRAELDDLYRRGIDLSRVSYWIEAHDLIAACVRPNVASQWRHEGRVISDEADVRAWVDRVLDDEFPLSMFYETLKKKLAEAAPEQLVEPVASKAA